MNLFVEIMFLPMSKVKSTNIIGMAIELFKHMKSCGMLPNDATYNIMIDIRLCSCFHDDS
ncbi:hypothetical protein G4B88_009106 [Cannabis sativa]|uniref:Pentatricopeptide repeat-containing protein n=1 Tax=Cannabis sativa TaxID=3483 RepID=A0A7J6HSF0_CANSA|nr:hypothetical protein G4B88_009106 [Cannabis sativa]